MDLNYDEIFENEDRSYTFKLIDILKNNKISEDERGRVEETLEELEDPRCWNLLYKTVLDLSYDYKIRESAIEILSNSSFTIKKENQLKLWKNKDVLIKKSALYFMEREEKNRKTSN